MKHYTIIEQSKKLVELGLNPDTADMCYIQTPADEYRLTAYNLEYCNNLKQQRGSDMNLIPCWSLGALLSIIPNYQLQTQDKGVGILFGCRKELKIIETSTPTEAVYNMVCWLLENGYIKKGE